MSVMKRSLSLLLVGILLPACGGGGGGGGGGTPPTPFTVVQRVPGNGATGVVRTSNLYVRLNRAANGVTVNTTNVSLLLDGATSVPRTVTYDAANLMVVIDPASPLNIPPAVYTVSLGAGVQDTGGVPLTPDTFTFSASSNTDTTLPAFATANFALASATTTQLDLQWQAATDASAPISYELFVLPSSGVFDPTSTPNLTTANLTGSLAGLSSNTQYNLRLRARDAAGNLSSQLHTLNPAKTLTSWSLDVHAGIINGPIVNRCTRCHAPGGMEVVPFTMETPAIGYGNLVGVDASCTLGGLPPGIKRVATGGGTTARDNSFLWLKINPSPPCGERMPRDGFNPGIGYLNATQIQTIGDWIIEGALDN